MNALEDFIIPPLAVVCHDAGAANVIIPWLKSYKNDMNICMEGPAKIIWKRHFPEYELSPIEEVLTDKNTLLSGTGWGNLEFEARNKAYKKGIKNIAVIDHWTNYNGRFIRDRNQLLPDLIFVSDKYAHKIACIAFPSIKVCQLPNIYLQDEANLASSVRVEEIQKVIENILVIAEPFREKIPGKELALEFRAIEFLMLNLNKINLSKKLLNITLRLHPSELPNKYDFLINNYKDTVTEFKISTNKELYEDVAWADLVVGISSFALVVSLTAGVPTMSILPPGSKNFMLPYDEVINLRDL